MNLKILKKSKHHPRTGDIFIMLPPDELYLYGRVISIKAKIGPMEGCVLIYVYNERTKNRLPIPALSVSKLLVPPMMTNNLPWARGYFETIAHEDLQPHEVLKQHCFFDALQGSYFDEFSNPVDNPTEPIGMWGLHSFQTIDDEISKALGIQLSP